LQIILEKNVITQSDNVAHSDFFVKDGSDLKDSNVNDNKLSYDSCHIDHATPQTKLFESNVSSKEIEKTMLKVVDFYGEIVRLQKSSEASLADILNFVNGRLIEIIESGNGEIISLDNWDTQQQRAVIIEYDDKLDSVIIKESVSYGLKRNSKIIRKQDVVIVMNKNQKGEKNA